MLYCKIHMFMFIYWWAGVHSRLIRMTVWSLHSLFPRLPSSPPNQPHYESNIWLWVNTISNTAPSELSIASSGLKLRIELCFSDITSSPACINTYSTVEPSPSCWAAYLCAADNCSLDNVKLAHTGEWGLLKTVMMADFMQFVMRGFVQ